MRPTAPEPPHASALPFAFGLVCPMVFLVACGELGCPEGQELVDGVCEAPPTTEPEPPARDELCDGVDNDDDGEVDEDWPELGSSCSECPGSEWVCRGDGRGITCSGQTATVEACDGVDNDCDGLVDEGVLDVRQQPVEDFTMMLTSVPGGFAAAYVDHDKLTVQTYGEDGSRTESVATTAAVGARWVADMASQADTVFIALATSGDGQNTDIEIVEVKVDDQLNPTISDRSGVHSTWGSGFDLLPHVQVRIVTGNDFNMLVGSSFTDTENRFQVVEFGPGGLGGVSATPTGLASVPAGSLFDVSEEAGLVWGGFPLVGGGELKAGTLEGASLSAVTTTASGRVPRVAAGKPGSYGFAYVTEEGAVRLSELGLEDNRCEIGSFCGEALAVLSGGALGLAFRDGLWFVAVGGEVLIVANDGAGDAEIVQTAARGDIAPLNAHVVTSGPTTAVLTTTDISGESALAFLGCF